MFGFESLSVLTGILSILGIVFCVTAFQLCSVQQGLLQLWLLPVTFSVPCMCLLPCFDNFPSVSLLY